MKFLSKFEAHAYLLLRLVFGFLYACHGAQKMFGILGGHKVPPGANLDFLGTIIELAAGVLIFFGLFTRPAAFIASGEMAVAYFMVHDHSPAAVHGGYASFFPIVNHGELAVIYCFVALFIAARGAGQFGFDRS